MKAKIDLNLPVFPENLKDILEGAADIMYESVMTNFSRGGRPVSWKHKKDNTPSFLQETGRLKASIHKEIGENFVEVATAPKSAIPYVFIHQFGGNAGRGQSVYIPARPYMMFQQWDKEKLRKLIGDHIRMSATKRKPQDKYMHRSEEF